MIAVNIADMTKDMILAQFLIAPVITNRAQCKAETGKIDGMALVLDCDGKQARAIVAVARIRHSRDSFRFYESNIGKDWKRI